MHRSGTSAFSRVLNLLGCDLAGDLVPPRDNDNPKGFWEGRAVVELNKAIDESIGFLWNDVRPVPTDWYETPEKAALLDQAVAALTADFADSDLFTIKDPRVCRHMPFWREALAHIDVEPVVVMPIRHPDAVAASIAARNKIPSASSHMSWLRHVLDAEAASRDLPRCVLRYDDILRDWRAVAARIAAQTGLNWPNDSAAMAPEIDAFLDPGERHHDRADDDALPDWVATANTIMTRMADDAAADGDWGLLDTIRAEFDRAAPIIAPLANQSTTMARSVVGEHRKDIKRRERETTALRKRLADEQEGLRKAKATITTMRQDLTATEHTLKSTNRDLENARRRIARYKSEVKNLSAAMLDQGIGSRTIDEAPSKALRKMARGSFYRGLRRLQLRKHVRMLEASDLFDPEWYAATYPDVAESGVRPAVHYLLVGAHALRDPSPRFSTARHLRANPKLTRTLRNPLLHYLKRNDLLPDEAVAPPAATEAMREEPATNARQQELRRRLESGVLGQMVAKASVHDPLVAHTWPEISEPKLPPFHSPMNWGRLNAMLTLQKAADHRRARIVILVNRPRWGGARRMEGYIAHAAAAQYGAGEVMLVATDHGGDMPEGKLPDNCRYVDFATATADLRDNERQRVLVEFLRSLTPSAVFSVNSRMLWNAMTPFGKALTATVPVYACLFCNEQTPLGYWTGYPVRFFYRHFDSLAGVCMDSHFLQDWLSSIYKVPPAETSRLHVLEAPVDPALGIAPTPEATPGRRPQVFWSGRFDRQKRIDIVYRIAEEMPHADFRMWGEPVLSKNAVPEKKPDNIIHEGVYARFEDLPLDQADAWLYTSEWDGVPSILLEVAMSGVPLVGSIAGGTGEVLHADLSVPVADIENIAAYKAGLDSIFEAPASARARAITLRERLLEQRTAERYQEAIAAIVEKEPHNG